MLELHHAPAREEGGIHLEIRVLGRRADHDDGAILDSMEQGILLRARKTVDLVDKEDGLASVGEKPVLGLIDLSTQVLDRSRNGRDLHELALGMGGDDAGEGRFARARRSVEDHAREHVMLDRRTKPRPGADGFGLADVLIERRRPHADRKRGALEGTLAIVVTEQIVH